MLKNPQAKGKRAEYFVRDLLRGAGYTAERNPMSGAISWLKGDIRSSFPFFVEVKNQEKTQFAEWYKKAKDQSINQPPIIFWTRNNEDMYVFLKATDFLSAIEGKTAQPIPKSKKKQKITPEDQAWQAFPKSYQVRRKTKT